LITFFVHDDTITLREFGEEGHVKNICYDLFRLYVFSRTTENCWKHYHL